MVLLTSHRADTPDQVARILAMYFGRWAIEEMHRFAKQSFKLENIRALTWKRLKNLVAAVWIVLGAIAPSPSARTRRRPCVPSNCCLRGSFSPYNAHSSGAMRSQTGCASARAWPGTC